MISRIVALILILVIVIGGGILIYRFFSNPDETNAKVLTIDSNGRFTEDELKVANNEVLRIKNEDDKNYTVKNAQTDETIVEVEPNSTSREIELRDNAKISLKLASNDSERTTLVVGTPPTETADNAPEAEEQPSNEPVQGANTNNSQTPLPDTGPEEYLVYPLLAIIGFLIARFSTKLINY